MNPLSYDYQKPNQPPHDPTQFRISASQFSKFFDSTSQWCHQHLLGESGFLGNTASVAGTVLHHLAEQHTLNQSISEQDRADIAEYIALQASDDVVADDVLPRVRPMWNVLKEHITEHPISLPEPFIQVATGNPGIFVGGSIDGIIDLTDPSASYQSLDDLPRDHQYKVIDYKSTSSKTPPKSFSKQYDWQLLTYAYALSTIGINVVEVELIFILQEHIGAISEKTGKQLKSYPAAVHTLAKSITSDDLAFIQSLINLVSDSAFRFITTPSDRYLIAQDYRLVNNNQPLPFVTKPQSIDI